MMFSRFGLLSIATILVILWIVLALKYENVYAVYVEAIDPEEYRYPELFCIGFAIMKFLKISTKSKRARKRIKEISEVRGKKYAEYYYYIINGAKWTYGFTLLVLFVLLAALGNSGIALLLGIVLAALIMVYLEELMNDKLAERRDEILSDMPQMLSKLTLLVNSGMNLRDAWKKVAEGENRVIYLEMQTAVQEMQNGIPEWESYRNFADRCALKEVRRFASAMIQNLQKGSTEIAYFLRDMADEMWEEKKHLAKRKGEAANSKLLLPIAMIFIGILVMIMVPAFTNM